MDEVVIGAPYTVTKALMDHFNVSKKQAQKPTTLVATTLVKSKVVSRSYKSLSTQVGLVCHGDTPVSPDVDGVDPYAEPKKQGKFSVVPSGNPLTTEMLVQRIVARRLDYEKRNEKKEKKEKAAYEAYMKVQAADS